MKFSDSLFALSVKMAVCSAPTISTVFFPSSTANTISPTPVLNLPSEFPYTKYLTGINLTEVLPITCNHYPLGISNGTHYYIYLIDTSNFSQDTTNSGIDSGISIWTQVNDTRFFKVKEGAPAWKNKRDEPTVNSSHQSFVRTILSKWKRKVSEEEKIELKPWLWWRPFPGAAIW
ncbi:uncharacterized protein SAPINGB_P000607 [Magnusiomyces paraingens]|uniref:Uncharacterized protein n=1 Tax=Magnusiomyces paraingens TaxID=2606893 RepID=A0A5E8B1R9_9ASCO|nr:uncharacterized protein SAPINGB_P000607 [Saprochaete ingens]VVT45009.1 unnamed protein product [Saprochaete ingens]